MNISIKDVILVLLPSALAACAAQPRNLDEAAPQTGAVVSCSGYKTWDDCHAAAAKTCPGGYEVIARDENLVAQGRTLRIQCK